MKPKGNEGTAVKKTVTIKQNHEFRRMYQKGKSAVTPSMVVYCRKSRLGHNRLGITVSVKLGCAVKRNRARRRLRELFRLAQPIMVQGYDVIIVARSRTVTAPHKKLKADFDRALHELGLVAAP